MALVRIRSSRMGAAVCALAIAAGVLSGCASTSSSGDLALVRTVPQAVTVQTRSVAGLGHVLADGAGHVLYIFTPDARSRVSCVGACAGTWPALAIAPGHSPSGRGVDRALLSTLPDPNTGARVVTYGGYPLYRYTGDVDAATANGQALFLDGGPWYVLNQRGQPLTMDPAVSK